MGVREANMNRVLQNGSSFSEISKNNTVSMIIKEFKSSPSYKEVKFNGSTILTGVQIVDDSTAISQSSYNSKIIIMKPNDILNVGDVIDDGSQTWICTLAELYGDIYYTGKIAKATHFISLYKNSISWQIPICVESATRLYQLGVETNKYISEPSTTIVVRMPNNDITSQIKRSEIFKIGMQNYEVKDINDVIENGLLVLKMEWSSKEIIEPISPTPLPTGITVQITGDSSIVKGKSSNYIAKFYNNGVEVNTELSTFYLTGDDGILPTTLANISSQDTNGNCTVVVGNILGYVKLFCKNADGSIISEPFRIQIKNIFG